MSQQQLTIEFHDPINNDDCFAIIKQEGTSIGICLSAMRNGDIEVCLTAEDALRVANALQQLASTK